MTLGEKMPVMFESTTGMAIPGCYKMLILKERRHMILQAGQFHSQPTGRRWRLGGFGTMAMVLMLVMFGVFGWDGNAWVQQGIDIDGEAEGDWLGYSVSLSGDGTTLAVGAPKNDRGAGSSSNTADVVMSGSSVGLAVNGYSKVQP